MDLDVLARLDQLHADHERAFILSGEPGVGKSYTARAWRARFSAAPAAPKSVWLDVRVGTTLEDLAARLARALDAPTAELAMTQHPGGLLVIDGAEALDGELLSSLLEHWVALGADWTILLTAHGRPWASARVIELDPLSFEQSVALFERRLGRPVQDHAAMLRLVTQLDGNPLAIELAAASARYGSLDAMLSTLHQSQGWEAQPAIRGVFDALLTHHSPEALQGLMVCASFEGRFNLSAYRAICDDLSLAVAGLEPWLEGHLLRQDEADLSRYYMLKPLRRAVLERAAAQTSFTAALSAAHTRYFQRRVQGLSPTALLDGSLEPELEDLLKAYERLRGSAGSGDFGPLLSWLVARRSASSVWRLDGAARAVPNATSSASTAELISRSRELFNQGQHEAARQELEEARERLERQPPAQASRQALEVHMGLASLALRHKTGAHYARHCLERALDYAAICGDEAAQLKVVGRLAALAQREQQPQQAMRWYEATLQLLAHSARPDRLKLQAQARAQVAALWLRIERHEDAQRMAHDILIHARQSDDPGSEAQARYVLARLAMHELRLESAQRELDVVNAMIQAHQLDRTMRELVGVARWAQLELALWRDDLETLERALKQAQALVLSPPELELLSRWLGIFELAHHRYERAREIFEHSAMMDSAGDSLLTLALWELGLALCGEREQARQRLAMMSSRCEVLQVRVTLAWIECVMRVLGGEPLAQCSPAPLDVPLTSALDAFLCRLATTSQTSYGVWMHHARASSLKDQVVIVSEDGMFLCDGHAREVCFEGKALMQRLLLMFLERRLQAPGQAIDAMEVFAAGWPHEAHTIRSAALNRVRVTLRRMRQDGLDGLLLTGPSGGYLLDPQRDFVITAR